MVLVALLLSALTLVAALLVLAAAVRAERAARERDRRAEQRGRRLAAAMAEVRSDLDRFGSEVARLAARVQTYRGGGSDDIDAGRRGQP